MRQGREAFEKYRQATYLGEAVGDRSAFVTWAAAGGSFVSRTATLPETNATRHTFRAPVVSKRTFSRMRLATHPDLEAYSDLWYSNGR